MRATESLTPADKILSALVFGCPSCQQQFQVGESQAGQVVQCPTCAQQVEIPANAFGATPDPTPQPAEEPIVFACPTCEGQFGITKEMNGQTVGCPHCQAPALIQLPDLPSHEPIAGPEINTKVEVSRRDKKEARKRAKAVINKEHQDLFAPGYSKPESPDTPGEPPETPASQQQITPKRRKPKKKKTTETSKPAPPSPGDSVQQSAVTETASEALATPEPTTTIPDEHVAKTTEPPADAENASAPPEPSGPEPIDHLLPPKFTVFDPNRVRVGSGNEKFKVVLPDGKGGTAQLDNRILRVSHGDEKVALVSLTEQQRARRNLIQNIIAILIGIGVMALAFFLLM